MKEEQTTENGLGMDTSMDFSIANQSANHNSNELSITTETDKHSSPVLKSRSSRVHKPNSFIFTSDIEVRMPRKKHTKKNLLVSNAIRTINKKAILKTDSTRLKTSSIRLSGYQLNNKIDTNKCTGNKINNAYNSKSNRLNGVNKRNKLVKVKRRYIKRNKQVSDNESLTLTNSSDDNTENNTLISNENKDLINLKSDLKLSQIFTKPLVITKNGKIRGRPRKPIAIDNLLNVLGNGLSVKKNGNNSTQEQFKQLLEKIDESHKNQLMKIRKELEDQEREKVVLNVKNASLIKENEALRNRIDNLINESQLRKELENIKNEHSKEISEIKKKHWCSNLNCEKQAHFFCCFNAFYCSTDCQVQHWSINHMKNCRNQNRNRKTNSNHKNSMHR